MKPLGARLVRKGYSGRACGDFADEGGTGDGFQQFIREFGGDGGEQAACGLGIKEQGFQRRVWACDTAYGGGAVGGGEAGSLSCGGQSEGSGQGWDGGLVEGGRGVGGVEDF